MAKLARHNSTPTQSTVQTVAADPIRIATPIAVVQQAPSLTSKPKKQAVSVQNQTPETVFGSYRAFTVVDNPIKPAKSFFAEGAPASISEVNGRGPGDQNVVGYDGRYPIFAQPIAPMPSPDGAVFSLPATKVDVYTPDPVKQAELPLTKQADAPPPKAVVQPISVSTDWQRIGTGLTIASTVPNLPTPIVSPQKQRSDEKPREQKMMCKARPTNNKPKGGGGPKRFVPWC